MSVSERVRNLVEPIVADEGVELFDLEQAGSVLRVTVDRAGGLDMEAIASLTRALSRALDEHDPITGQYTLEVSSPGLERTLRTPAHFAWAVGRDVAVKAVAGFEGGRRFSGTLAAADAGGIVVDLDEPSGSEVALRYDEVEKARTVFEWGPTPKPGGPKGGAKSSGKGTGKNAATSAGKNAAKRAGKSGADKGSKSRGPSPTTTQSPTQKKKVPE